MKKKNILVLYDNRDLDRQVLKPVDYTAFEQEWIRQNGGNSGNKLFNTAVEQYLTKEDIDYAYYNGSESVEEINEKYDLAIFTTANIFNAHPRIRKELDDFAEMIGKFKRLIYLCILNGPRRSFRAYIPCGGQASDNVNIWKAAINLEILKKDF